MYKTILPDKHTFNWIVNFFPSSLANGITETNNNSYNPLLRYILCTLHTSANLRSLLPIRNCSLPNQMFIVWSPTIQSVSHIMNSNEACKTRTRSGTVIFIPCDVDETQIEDTCFGFISDSRVYYWSPDIIWAHTYTYTSILSHLALELSWRHDAMLHSCYSCCHFQLMPRTAEHGNAVLLRSSPWEHRIILRSGQLVNSVYRNIAHIAYSTTYENSEDSSWY